MAPIVSARMTTQQPRAARERRKPSRSAGESRVIENDFGTLELAPSRFRSTLIVWVTRAAGSESLS